MSNLSFITPEWKVSGKSANEFFNELEALENRTMYIKKRMASCAWLSIISEENFEKENINPVSFNNARLKEGDVWAGKAFTCFDNTRNNNMAVPVANVITFGDDNEKKAFKNAIENVGGMLSFDIDGTPTLIPISPWGYKDLSDRAGVSCKKTAIRSQNRDRWLTENFTSDYVTFVVRKAEDEDSDKVMYKAFAVRGQIYKDQSQKELIKATQKVLEEDLGESNSVHWSITNENTDIALTFPKKQKEIKDFYPSIPDDCVPIVKISTSDTGNSAFHVSAGFYIGGFDLITKNGTVSCVHDKNLSPKKLSDEINKKLYPEFIAIPENLARLLGIEVPNVAIGIEEVIDFIGIEKKVGLRSIGKKIKEQLIYEMSMAGVNYTAYDIVTELMTIQNRLTLTKKNGDPKVIPPSTQKSLEDCLSQAIFCPFETSTVNINFV